MKPCFWSRCSPVRRARSPLSAGTELSHHQGSVLHDAPVGQGVSLRDGYLVVVHFLRDSHGRSFAGQRPFPFDDFVIPLAFPVALGDAAPAIEQIGGDPAGLRVDRAKLQALRRSCSAALDIRLRRRAGSRGGTGDIPPRDASCCLPSSDQQELPAQTQFRGHLSSASDPVLEAGDVGFRRAVPLADEPSAPRIVKRLRRHQDQRTRLDAFLLIRRRLCSILVLIHRARGYGQHCRCQHDGKLSHQNLRFFNVHVLSDRATDKHTWPLILLHPITLENRNARFSKPRFS